MSDYAERLCEIAECEFCDDNGLRPNNTCCDHIDYAAIAKRGIAKIRAALQK